MALQREQDALVAEMAVLRTTSGDAIMQMETIQMREEEVAQKMAAATRVQAARIIKLSAEVERATAEARRKDLEVAAARTAMAAKDADMKKLQTDVAELSQLVSDRSISLVEMIRYVMSCAPAIDANGDECYWFTEKREFEIPLDFRWQEGVWMKPYRHLGDVDDKSTGYMNFARIRQNRDNSVYKRQQERRQKGFWRLRRQPPPVEQVA